MFRERETKYANVSLELSSRFAVELQDSTSFASFSKVFISGLKIKRKRKDSKYGTDVSTLQGTCIFFLLHAGTRVLFCFVQSIVVDKENYVVTGVSFFTLN